MRIAVLSAILASSSLLAAPAFADLVKFKADLSGKQEVPPHADLKGAGTVEATVDTTNLNMAYHVEFTDLTGKAQAAHFHGPAGPGKNAGVQVPVAGGIMTGMDGKATISADQFRMLQDGQMYFNIHTQANPGGELRGQLMKAM